MPMVREDDAEDAITMAKASKAVSEYSSGPSLGDIRSKILRLSRWQAAVFSFDAKPVSRRLFL